MNMKRILIVDDDSSVGTMLKFVIAREQLGEVVATVTDEEQAVDEILLICCFRTPMEYAL